MTRRVEGPVTRSAITVIVPQVRAGSLLLRIKNIVRRGSVRRWCDERSCPEDKGLVAKSRGCKADDNVIRGRWRE
jgi:hypothetical protein